MSEENNDAPREGLFDVHVYHLVRTKIPNIAAGSWEEAAEIAHKAVASRTGDLLVCHGENGFTEDAEEIQGYLVDVVGDTEYEQTTYLERNHEGRLVSCVMRSYAQLRNAHYKE
jgi:hypothetical protein